MSNIYLHELKNGTKVRVRYRYSRCDLCDEEIIEDTGTVKSYIFDNSDIRSKIVLDNSGWEITHDDEIVDIEVIKSEN